MSYDPSMRRKESPSRKATPKLTPAAAEPETRPTVILVTLFVTVGLVLVAWLFSSGSRQPPVAGTPPPEPAAAVVENSGVTEIPKEIASAKLVGTRSPAAAPRVGAGASIAEQWGIQITSMRLTAGGHGLDMRYLVLDPEKAAGLLHLEEVTFVVDEASQKNLLLPLQRENHTTQKLQRGRTYFALLPNKGQLLQSGSKVKVGFGTSQTENLVIQ